MIVNVKFFKMKYLFFTLGILLSFAGYAQKIPTVGTVTDSSGTPLAGVSVVEHGTNNGTSTNNEGKFKISVQKDAILEFSSVGYMDQKVSASSNNLHIVMPISLTTGRDVVVVAYGTQQRSKMTSSQTSISSKDFESQPVSRLDQVLQGRTSGVQVTNTTGAPGGDVRIRIRGANSITGNNSPLYVLDGFVGADFNTINPDDIANIQILKDAAATAPYGSRGANGVVIVTTKKGSSGKADFSVSSKLSSSKIIKTYDVLSPADFADVVNARAELDGTSAVFSPDQIKGFKENGGTDWQKEIYRPGLGQAYEMNVNGGNGNTNYYISGAYDNQQGIIKNSSYKFYSLRSNINIHLAKNFSTYLNINGFVRHNLNTFLQTGTANPVVQSLAWAPTTPVYDADGNFTRKDPVGSQAYNPLAEALDRNARTDDYSINMSGGFLYNILNGLSLNIQYGINFDNSQYKNSGTQYVAENTYAGRTFGNTLSLQNTNTLHYEHNFNGIHDLDLTAVMEVQKDSWEGFNVNIQNLVYPDFNWNNLALADINGVGSGKTESSLLSFFGRVNYSLMNKYLFSATVRRDGSSKFRGENKYSYFPSLSLGWILSKEKFIDNLNLFHELKLRGSWGLTGNQAIGPYSTYSTYKNVSTAYNSTSFIPGIWINTAGNPDLKWETTEQKDLGIDMSFLDGRLYSNVDYFIKETKDLLLASGLPNFIGGGSIMLNVGSVQNSGWEFNFGGTPVKTKSFSWNTNFNFSLVANKVLKLSEGGGDDWSMSSGTNWGSQPDFRLKSGESMGAINGIKYLGTWKPSEAAEAAKYNNVPGDSKYLDLNGDHVIDGSDNTIIGQGLPKYTIGWNNTFNYKQFELNIFTQGVLGFDKYNYIYGMMVSTFGDFKQPTSADIKNRYIPGVNETSDIPAFSKTNQNIPLSSRFVSKGDFLRIKNVSISYTLPKTNLKNIASAKLFLSITNLYTFTKYSGLDPEGANTGSGSDVYQNFDYGSYPIPRVYTAGITLTF